MTTSFQRRALALAGLVLLTIYGCGGGGGGGETANPGAAPVATASLGALRFESAGNWFVQSFTSSSAQNTPDASNNIRYVERRSNSTSSGATTVANWNKGGSPARQADLHFTGTAWENCGLNGENLESVRDAAGNSTLNYCNSLSTSSSKRTTSDVGSQTMASVITAIRTAGYPNLSVGDNSASALNTLLGGTTFPAGSTLSLQNLTALTTAPAYYPGIGNFVLQSDAEVAKGRTNPTDTSAACATNTATPPDAISLDALVAVNAGTPCVNSPTAITPASGYSGPRNESWGATSLSLGVIGTAPLSSTATTYYTTNNLIRVAFGANNSALYFTCQQRSTDGSARNCNPISIGAYTIATLGDARVMTFSGLPPESAPLSFTRVFVERGGKIYFGYQDKLVNSSTVQLNLAASNALLGQLGIPALTPETPMALTASSYAGIWDVASATAPTRVLRISIPVAGSASCENVPVGGTPTVVPCTFAINDPATGAFSYSDGAGDTLQTAAGTFSFLAGRVAGTFRNSIETGTLAGSRR